MKLVAGECIVDLHPTGEGNCEAATTYAPRPGGAPANVAVGLARLGEPPLLWTRLGRDDLGDLLADALVAEGIPDALVERDADAPTGLAVVSGEADGDRSFGLHLEGTATATLEPGAVDDATLEAVDWVHCGGVTLALERARAATFDLLDRVPPDATVSFDPNARSGLWRTFDYADALDRALSAVDVVVASPADLRPAGFEGDGPALVDALLEAGPHTALLTLGARGATARATADAPWGPAEADHSGFTVDAVDTTGAGDAFAAGAIAALDEGRPFGEALAFANAVGAASTTAAGAMAALPDRAAVEALLGGD